MGAQGWRAIAVTLPRTKRDEEHVAVGQTAMKLLRQSGERRRGWEGRPVSSILLSPTLRSGRPLCPSFHRSYFSKLHAKNERLRSGSGNERETKVRVFDDGDDEETVGPQGQMREGAERVCCTADGMRRRCEGAARWLR